MEIIGYMLINTLIIILGFCFCFNQVIKYFTHQDILRKSESVTEYTQRELALNTPIPEEEEQEDQQYKDITDVTVEEVFKTR